MIADAKLAFIDRRASMEHIYSEGFSHQRARPVPA
jgi:CDP-4-dehydro-6-deoxyglucose reductase, E3